MHKLFEMYHPFVENIDNARILLKYLLFNCIPLLLTKETE